MTKAVTFDSDESSATWDAKAQAPVNSYNALLYYGYLQEHEKIINLCRTLLNLKCGARVMRITDEAEVAKRIFDAYPFAVRRGSAYGAWRQAVHEWYRHREKLKSWEH